MDASSDEAVREVRDAVTVTDITWPREPSEGYEAHRLLLRARLTLLPAQEDVEGPDRLPTALREQLREEFLALYDAGVNLPGRQLAAALSHGMDMDDREAAQAEVRADNARRLAEAARETFDDA